MASKRFNTVAIALALTAMGATLSYSVVSEYYTPGDIATGPTASKIPVAVTTENIGHWLDSLPPTAAGVPSATGASPDSQGTMPAAQPAEKADMNLLRPNNSASVARGRVERVYVRVAQGLLMELSVAQREHRDGWRYVELDFAEPLLNGTTNALALVPTDGPEVGIGDVVEMRFATKTIGKKFSHVAFPERDKVTGLVARAGSSLANDYQQRIAARTRADGSADDPVDTALWGKLPLDKAIKIVRGTGKREMAVFSDPYCSACQAFEQTLKQMDDVTVYVFMLPVIRPDKADQSRSVWCSADRAQAWQELALDHKVPQASSTCENPVDAVLAMRQSIGIRATPTIFFRDGKRGQGNMQASILRESLARSEPASLHASVR